MTRTALAVVFLTLFAGLLVAGEPSIAGCPMFPNNNIWNTPIDNLPVHPMSDTYVYTVGAQARLHADWGSGYYFGGVPFGLPVTYVFGTQPKVPVYFDNPGESDPGPYPLPANTGVQADSDSHVIVLDKDNCILYELWAARRNTDGSWSAGSGAKFDTRSNALRPFGWTSANAAGTAFLPALVRYDEIMTGEIKHAVGMTVNYTQDSLLWPARHHTIMNISPNFPPMGARFRLKAGVDISRFHPQVQVLLRALKKYGAYINDNGAPWFIAGVPDSRWDDNIWTQMHELHGSDFEMVDQSGLMVDPNSGEARGVPLVPVSVAVTPATATVAAGGGVQLAVQVSGSSDTAVNWYVSGGGTVSQGGYYQAPSGITAPVTAVVTAISAVDSIRSAASTITVVPGVSVNVAPASVTLTDGQSQQFTAQLVDPAGQGVTWAVVSGPGSISIAGLYHAPASLASPQTATVSCRSRADAAKVAHATVSLVPGSGPSLSMMWLSTASIAGGDSAALVILLSRPAPAGGAVVLLTSSNTAAATVPASVTIAEGSTIAVATVTTARSGATASATITAQAGGVSKSALLTVQGGAAAVESLPVAWMALSTYSIAGGDTAAVIFQLSRPAPAGGGLVALSSSNPGVASVPSTVRVPEGGMVGVANIPTARVTGAFAVSIGAGAKSAVLTVY